MADSNLYGLPTVQAVFDPTSQLYAVTGTNGSFTDTRLPTSVMLAGYLQTVTAQSTYLSIANASSTYLTQANAASTYATITNLALKAPLSGNLSQFATTTSAQLAGVISDETGTGALVFGTSPTITTPNIVGVTTVSNATAGSVGEFLTNQTVATPITSNSTFNATSISLTPGDWDVSGTVEFIPAASTIISSIISGINTVSATPPTAGGGARNTIQTTFATSQFQELSTPMVRVNIATTTTVYLIGFCTFSTSTCTATGYIRARRVR